MLHKVNRVVVNGPESTGKTELCKYLSKKFDTLFVPEFARGYVENLGRSYRYEDVELIANQQFTDLRKEYSEAKEFVFFDTDLIITKVWFDVVYGKMPNELEAMIIQSKPDYCFLCYPDIDWVPDPVRENGGEARIFLYNRYLHELQHYKIPFETINGTGEERFLLAEKKLRRFFNLAE